MRGKEEYKIKLKRLNYYSGPENLLFCEWTMKVFFLGGGAGFGAELQKVSSGNIFKEDLKRNVRTELRSVGREH